MTQHSDAPTYYGATATPYDAWAPLSGTHETQVCIIGAGLAGLSTALELAERKVDSVVLEAKDIAWGASGRNGGFVSDGFSLGGGTLVRQLGRECKFRGKATRHFGSFRLVISVESDQ